MLLVFCRRLRFLAGRMAVLEHSGLRPAQAACPAGYRRHRWATARGFARRRTGAESSVRGPLVGGHWDCYARAARFIDAAALLRVREHEMAPAPLRADAGGSGAGAKVLQ